MSIINRGSEFLTKKVLKYYPCLTEFLISLQNIQKQDNEVVESAIATKLIPVMTVFI